MVKKLFLEDRFILILIIINALLIFVQDFNNTPNFIDYFDNIFTILFTCEMFVKIQHYGLKKYWNYNWNKFDSILVIIALMGLFFEIFNLSHPISLEYILVLRVLRLFKSFRLFKFVPNIKSILNGLNEALKSSYVVIISFIILLFIVSVLTCSIFKNISPEYFSTPLNSLYTIFRVFSIEGWYEIPDLIAERTSNIGAFFTKIYFVLLLFFGGILGMSLINSIFVDAMVSDNNDELEEKVEALNKK